MLFNCNVVVATCRTVLGVDSEFCNVEALVTGIVDNWPEQLLRHRRKFTGRGSYSAAGSYSAVDSYSAAGSYSGWLILCSWLLFSSWILISSWLILSS